MRLLLVFMMVILMAFIPEFMPGQSSGTIPGRKEKECFQKDIGDVLRKGRKKAKPHSKTMLLVLPNISYNPVNGFLMGGSINRKDSTFPERKLSEADRIS